MQSTAQSDPRGKDLFQLRDDLYNYARNWLLKAGLSRAALEQSLSFVMNSVDKVIVGHSLDVNTKNQMLYQARSEFDKLVAWHAVTNREGKPGALGTESDRNAIMKGFDSTLRNLVKSIPERDPEEWSPSDISKLIKRQVDSHEKAEPSIRQASPGQYEILLNTEEGEFSLGTFPAETPLQASNMLQVVKDVASQFSKLKGDKSYEAQTQKLRLVMSDPFEMVPGQTGPEITGRKASFKKADEIIRMTLTEIRRIWGEIHQEIISFRQSSHNIDPSSITTLFNQAIMDLTQSSLAMGQASMGKGGLDLSQFGRAWLPSRHAQALPQQAHRIQALVKEAIQVFEHMNEALSNVVLDMSSVLGKPAVQAGSSSWKLAAPVMDSVTISPSQTPAAPKGVPGTAPSAPPKQQPKAKEPSGPREDQELRLLKWELSLAMGAANRASKQLNNLLGDQSFWSQFVRSYGVWEPSWRPTQKPGTAPAPAQPEHMGEAFQSQFVPPGV